MELTRFGFKTHKTSTDGHHEWACDVMNDESVAFCIRSDPLQFVDGSARDALTSYRVVGAESTILEWN